MREDRPDPFRPGIGFDPVCGGEVESGQAIPFFDGNRIHYFCSVNCRRVFFEERRPRRLPREPGFERPRPEGAPEI